MKSSDSESVTLVTVHGTFAEHEDDLGNAWWQKGSPFLTKLQHWLSLQTASLSILPFHWDGRNSQLSRIGASRQLAKKILELEEKRVPYHIIGHSHAGNIIWQALSGASMDRLALFPDSKLFDRWRNPKSILPYLQSWITIGTPFFSKVDGGPLLQPPGYTLKAYIGHAG